MQTLAAPAQLEQDVRKSRFLAHATSIDAPDAALGFLAAVTVRDATHNCWAYRIGQQYRFSDDGEPAGTAGKPILAAIDGQQLDRVVVVVTRWYGGIKLGAGGLVRAYGGCAAECLRRAERRTLVLQLDAELRCAFAHVRTVHALLAQHAASKRDERYEADGVVIALRVPQERIATFADALRDATRGQVLLHVDASAVATPD